MSATLSIDIGGTKILAALVRGKEVLKSGTVPTSRGDGPDRWVSQAAELAARWRGEFDRCGVTVTGKVHGGLWSAMNPRTLDIPDGYPLESRVAAVFDVPVTLCNDAQAAAWGEYCFGAGNQTDTVFLTVSTGIGGGAVIDGRLIQGQSGIAGHFGLLQSESGALLEDTASGSWIADEAALRGHSAGGPEVFAAAANGEAWAKNIIDESAAHIAGLCRNLQLIFDPAVIVIGGGVGLAPGYLPRVKAKLEILPAGVSSTLARAALGANAGVLGIAALANLKNTREIRK
ncbi:ROK family protein [Nitratireductor sp. XY-223]|uniref:ROK family protein n=1 Tax=Nitratireductor sp. XY-223 TaxID=2561926 RepID=UPI0010AB4333